MTWVRVVGLAAGVVVAASVSGCGVEEVTPAPSCDGGASILIVAQSVPTATLVPCLGRLPDGWSVTAVGVDESGTAVRFDSDRAGDDAAELTYTGDCDVSEATAVPSDHPPAARFETVHQLRPSFQADRAYVFDGGCATFSFTFAPGASATESVAIGEALSFVTRADLEAGLAETFIEERL